MAELPNSLNLFLRMRSVLNEPLRNEGLPDQPEIPTLDQVIQFAQVDWNKFRKDHSIKYGYWLFFASAKIN